ncbi:4Fe-4S binding protein [Desulfobacter curvatus]|uniref:4Fe-4S binding protein n=1 Tax=Desulfobacter curvatus TaxID=2290 RepID=UPI000379A267|nr:4Fe-4S binding protein [Desulfobacter curvatus]
MNTVEQITKRVILNFPQFNVGQPIITRLIRDFDLEINIYRARVTPNKEGYIAIDITGEESLIEEGLEFIQSLNVDINLTMNSLLWDKDRCTGCGNCVPHCPTGALHVMDKRTRQIDFHKDKCIECLSCVENCPFGACISIF